MKTRLVGTLLVLGLTGISLYESLRLIPDDAVERRAALDAGLPTSETFQHWENRSAAKESVSVVEPTAPKTLENVVVLHQSWAEAPRYGNYDDPLMNDTHIDEMLRSLPNLLDHAPYLLQQTLAVPGSRFLNLTDNDSDLWMTRLMYLSIHYHQHVPALAEAQERRQWQHGIGLYDFECPNTKYLVVRLENNGMGANVRRNLVPILLAAIASNRVAVFANTKRPWRLASCRRRDFQCFFAPTSPCVPTMKDLGRAYQLTSEEKMELLETGLLPTNHADDRAIYIEAEDPVPAVQRLRLGGKVEHILSNISHSLIDGLPPDDARVPMLRHAANAIDRLKAARQRPGFDFDGATSRLFHAAVIYAYRPNLSYAARLREMLPTDLDPERTIGLPIRASDKCDHESECLSYADHLHVATYQWNRTVGTPDPTVLLTTESKQVLEQHTRFVDESSDPAASYRFVLNDYDVLPDSGRGVSRVAGIDADEVMLSAVSSLRLQLMARMVIGNCCSGFHNLIDFLRGEGLGAAVDSQYHCLQQHEEPEYRICCWRKDDCVEKREKAIAKKRARLLAGGGQQEVIP